MLPNHTISLWCSPTYPIGAWISVCEHFFRAATIRQLERVFWRLPSSSWKRNADDKLAETMKRSFGCFALQDSNWSAAAGVAMMMVSKCVWCDKFGGTIKRSSHTTYPTRSPTCSILEIHKMPMPMTINYSLCYHFCSTNIRFW